uniref:Phage protein n=1 Tax=Meloidogyne incognita TaxID=6306 RepID=A0A914LXA2_MELIC
MRWTYNFASQCRYIGSVLDKMPKKFAITMKRDIAELIAKYEQKVAEEENE